MSRAAAARRSPHDLPPARPPTHVVGCGRLGLTLARCFEARGAIETAGIVTRSRASAEAARAFIEGGMAVEGLDGLGPARLVFVWTPDADLGAVAERLAASACPLEGVAVVHASGAHAAEVLAPLRARGAHVASIHPIRSFAMAERRDDVLEGVVCGAEGDAPALDVAIPVFESAGARIVRIASADKPIYHAAAVLACNHLVGLVESSLEAYAAAGVDRRLALAALEPLVRGTLDNVFEVGPSGALSGPIVRGESELVETQIERLTRVSPRLGDVYRLLAEQTLPLARASPQADRTRLDALEDVLRAASGREKRDD